MKRLHPIAGRKGKSPILVLIDLKDLIGGDGGLVSCPPPGILDSVSLMTP